MTPEQLAQRIHDSVHAAVSVGQLPMDMAHVPANVVVERPKNPEHGDWATNIALQLAKSAGMSPRDVAAVLSPYLLDIDGVEAADKIGRAHV